MLKDLETPRNPARGTYRRYTREFKAELVSACQRPGTSIAALANTHGMNANVLHRWLKEHARSGAHQLTGKLSPRPSGVSTAQQEMPAFIALAMPVALPEAHTQEIKVEVRRGGLTMSVTWPMSATVEFANWSAALLR